MRGQTNAENQLQTAEQVLAATQARVSAQALPEIQKERASLDVERYTQALADQRAAVQSKRIRLQQTLGSPGLNPGEVTLTPIPRPQSTPNLNATRPDLLSLRAQRLGAESDGKVANLSFLPDLELQARRAPWSSADQQYGVRLQLFFSLWDHGATRARIQSDRQQQQSFVLAEQDTLARADSEVAIAKVLADNSQKSVASYARLERGASELLKKVRRGFELGASSLLEVLDAQRAVNDVREQLSAAQLNADMANISLIVASGILILEEK